MFRKLYAKFIWVNFYTILIDEACRFLCIYYSIEHALQTWVELMDGRCVVHGGTCSPPDFSNL